MYGDPIPVAIAARTPYVVLVPAPAPARAGLPSPGTRLAVYTDSPRSISNAPPSAVAMCLHCSGGSARRSASPAARKASLPPNLETWAAVSQPTASGKSTTSESTSPGTVLAKYDRSPRTGAVGAGKQLNEDAGPHVISRKTVQQATIYVLRQGADVLRDDGLTGHFATGIIVAGCGYVPQPELAPPIIADVIDVDRHLAAAFGERLANQVPHPVGLGDRQKRQD